MKEIWKQIPGFSRYEVSNLGNIRSYAVPGKSEEIAKSPRLLSQRTNNLYKTVSIVNDNGYSKQVKVHKLVMLSFVGKRPNGMVICHKNNDKSDNRLENLEYGTREKNYLDSAQEYRTYPQKNDIDSLPDLSITVETKLERAEKIRELYDTGKYTQKDIAYMFKISDSGVSRIVNHQRRSDEVAIHPIKDRENNDSDYTRKMIYIGSNDGLHKWCNEQLDANRYENFSALSRDAIRCLRYFNNKYGDWRTQILEKGD